MNHYYSRKIQDLQIYILTSPSRLGMNLVSKVLGMLSWAFPHRIHNLQIGIFDQTNSAEMFRESKGYIQEIPQWRKFREGMLGNRLETLSNFLDYMSRGRKDFVFPHPGDPRNTRELQLYNLFDPSNFEMFLIHREFLISMTRL